MEFIPVDHIEGLEEDLRVVSVIWRGDYPSPVIDYSGCTPFEAAGMLRAALLRLEEHNADMVEFLEEQEDLESDDED